MELEDLSPGNKGKNYQLALDMLEHGDDENGSFEELRQASKQLPPEVNSRMLYKDVMQIAWPSFIEMLLAQLTSMADLMMVGRLGPWAIASVGLTTQPKFLLMAMFMAMNVGATALIARSKGAGDRQKANDILRQALLLNLVLSLVSSAIGFICAKNMVEFMGAAEAETLAGGTIYMKIQMAGFFIFALTSTITAALRGVGDSRTAMIYNLTANVVNIILNYCLIYGHFGFPRMEVAGASLATVIGQLVAFIMAVTVMLRGNHYLYLHLMDSFKPRWDCIKSIFNIGLPALLEQVVMRIGTIIYSKTVATLGTVAFATHQVCLNIQAMSFMIGNAFAVSATSLVGQSLGKKRPDMAHAYTSRTRRAGMVISVILAAALFLFGEVFVSLYTDEHEVIVQGGRILMFLAFIQPFQSSQFILMGSLRGAGDTRATAIIVFLTVFLVRPGIAIFNIRVLKWGLEGAWVAFVCDQLLRSLFVFLRYSSGKWKNIKV